MKAKQIEYLTGLRDNLLRVSAKPSEPSLSHHIRRALVHGEPLQLRSAKEITTAARDIIASSSYSRSDDMCFSKIFAPTKSFAEAKSKHLAAEEALEKRKKAFATEADALLRKAQLDDTANAEAIAAAIQILGQKHKLVT